MGAERHSLRNVVVLGADANSQPTLSIVTTSDDGLKLVFADGAVYSNHPETPPAFTLSFRNAAAERRVVLFGHIGLLEAMPKSGIQRQRIMEFIHRLRERPRTEGDFTDKDASLRIRQIKIVGDYAVTYWLDDPVKIVMVVDIRLADR
jgi:mRNA-degrading endonuclease RelE of RelBE toxin-antitoxin system